MYKKLLIIAAVLLATVTGSVQAQEDFYGNSYVKLQLTQPMGSFNDYYSTGFGAEYGRMFPFNMYLADGLIRPGLDITFIQTTFNTGIDHIYCTKPGIGDFMTTGGLMWNLDIKLGPMLTFDVTDGLLVDVAVQYVPTVSFNFRKGLNMDQYTESNCTDISTRSASSVSFAHRVGLKGDVRYGHFLFGIEFLFGSTELKYNHDIIPYGYTQGGTPDISVKDNADMGLSSFLLNVGFTF